jgi:hypothetical protein
MITLTLNVPAVATILAAGFTEIVVLKSSNQTAGGAYSQVGSPVALVAGQTSYSFTDPAGDYPDWYRTQYSNGASLTSSASGALPGYFSDAAQAIRDKLGVTTLDVPDTVIQQFGALPAGLAKIRAQLPTFDTLVAGGGDGQALCLQALICLVASGLCSRLKGVVMDSEYFKDYRYIRNKALDWDAAAEALLAEYDEALSLASGESATADHADVPGMLLGGPTRGGFDTSGGLEPFYPAGGVKTAARFDPITGLSLNN